MRTNEQVEHCSDSTCLASIFLATPSPPSSSCICADPKPSPSNGPFIERIKLQSDLDLPTTFSLLYALYTLLKVRSIATHDVRQTLRGILSLESLTPSQLFFSSQGPLCSNPFSNCLIPNVQVRLVPRTLWGRRLTSNSTCILSLFPPFFPPFPPTFLFTSSNFFPSSTLDRLTFTSIYDPTMRSALGLSLLPLFLGGATQVFAKKKSVTAHLMFGEMQDYKVEDHIADQKLAKESGIDAL